MRALLLACFALLVCACPAAAWTVAADEDGSVPDQHIVYPPFTSADHVAPWLTAANVGDVNGDGREDLSAGFAGAAPNDESSIYVSFSSPLPTAGAVAALTGFKITTRFFWFGLSSAGDVNGDGLGDVAIVRGDQVTVVFGRVDGATVDTTDLGRDGFTITGAGEYVGSGGGGVMLNKGVAPLGDVNGDGVPDLLVAAGAGAAIVYPPRDPAGVTIDAGRPGANVSTISVDEDHRLESASVWSVT